MDVSSNPSDVNLQHHEEEGVQVSKPIVISDSDEIVHDGVDNDEQSEDVVTALKRLTSRLQEHELSEDDIVSVLVELAQLEVTVPDLLETGAGKVVRRMKEKEGKVGRLAARLVIRWKRVVLVYDPGQEEKKKEKSVEEKFVVAEDVETNKQDDNANVSIAVNEHTAQDLLNKTGLESNSQDLGYDEEEIIQDDFPAPEIPDDIEYHYDPYEPEDEPPPFIEDAMGNDENIPPANLSENLSPKTPVREQSKTPVQSRYRTPVAVTPLPDYSAMLTPELRQELKRFGLKAVPRRKACLLLNHIYDQTHPLVPCTPLPRKIIKSSIDIAAKKNTDVPAKTSHNVADNKDDDDNHSDDDDLTSSQHMPEESILFEGDDNDDDETEDQLTQNSSATLHEQLTQFVRRRKSLYQSILLYEPLWIGQLLKDIKESGIKCKMPQLQDWLDTECITYRTESNRNKNKAANEKAKAKSKKAS